MNAGVIVFALCALACAVGHVAILQSVVRKGTSLADANVPRPRMMVELLWAIVPIIALAFVLTATWTRVRDHAKPRPDMIMKVAR